MSSQIPGFLALMKADVAFAAVVVVALGAFAGALFLVVGRGRPTTAADDTQRADATARR